MSADGSTLTGKDYRNMSAIATRLPANTVPAFAGGNTAPGMTNPLEHNSPAAPMPVNNPATWKTATVGGDDGMPFEDRNSSPLLGFIVSTSENNGEAVVKSVRPVYSEILDQSPSYGRPSTNAIIVVAKKGYAVGEICAKGSGRLDGFKIGFMRINGNRLDPNDRYESSWVGGVGGNEVKLGGGDNPRLVVGIYGKCSDSLSSLGLILLERKAK